MRIANVLKNKGDRVVTVAPDAPVTTLLDLLAEHRVGALVVSTDGETIEGIVSERDVVRGLQTRGAQILGESVSMIMTVEVDTCEPSASIHDLMVLMTERRFRHVPVAVDGRLRGIVSIGDVVKHRIDELQSERDQLTAYISS